MIRRWCERNYHDLEEKSDLIIISILLILAIGGIVGYVVLCSMNLLMLVLLPFFVLLILALLWKIVFNKLVYPDGGHRYNVDAYKDKYNDLKKENKKLLKTIALQNKMRNVKSL